MSGATFMARARACGRVRARGKPPFDLVVFDMDGTLTDRVSSWEWVHRSFGVDNRGDYDAFLRGEFGDVEFMRRDIAMWKATGPVHVSRVEAALAEIPLMPGAAELAAALRAEGTRTAIVTGGLDILAERVRRALRMDLQVANGLLVDEGGWLCDEGVLRVPVKDKGRVAARLLAELGVRPGRAAAVGNSGQDAGMFEACGFGLAFAPLDDEVRRAADVVVGEKDLRLAIPHLTTKRA